MLSPESRLADFPSLEGMTYLNTAEIDGEKLSRNEILDICR